jgi:hypothetical protein
MAFPEFNILSFFFVNMMMMMMMMISNYMQKPGAELTENVQNTNSNPAS